jgi:histidinol-phosphate aminotransferase
MADIDDLVRDNIKGLKPYSCARNEFTGIASVYLDANENPLNDPYNRYPDPLQTELKKKIAKVKWVRPEQLMLGSGSDEPIDLLIRIFCEPKVDNIVAMEPTYGMYRVCADINNVEYRPVLLREKDFSLDYRKVMEATDEHTKIIFLCSPNNPTGNVIDPFDVLRLFEGIVVVDEAYIDFCTRKSWITRLDEYSNLVVLQTFSKAWGMAAVRLGMAFANEQIIAYLNKVKYPYNINLLTQKFVYEALDNERRKLDWVINILDQRDYLEYALTTAPCVEKVYPSEANFLLVRVNNADKIYNSLVDKGIIVRNRSNIALCNGCLRITVGTEEENELLINTLKQL